MTVVTLRPNGGSTTGSLTGAGSVSAALSDDLDSSYTAITAATSTLTNLTDLSLPAGAVIKKLAARIRCARTAAGNTTVGSIIGGVGSTTPDAAVSVTWTVPTTVTGKVFEAAGITDAEADAATVETYSWTGGGTVRIYEHYLDVTYVVKPTLTVDAPTGTVTNTNLPTVTWTPTLDADGGPQTSYAIKVFTDAQYTAPGFDPNLSTATASAAGFPSAATSWQLSATLPDDTYRAYVRVGQSVTGASPSDWAFTEFTVSVALPAAPTITATADNTNARIALAVADVAGTASTDAVEVERSLDGGTIWGEVRGLEDGPLLNSPVIVAAGEFSDAADGTTHAAVLPAPDGGILEDDLLIAIAGMDGNPTFTWPTDWTEIKDEAGNGSAVRAAVAWKRAVGGESGTITVTTSASEGGGIRILCVRGAHATTAPEVSTGVSAATANADPDSLNPAGWGTEHTLWIAAMVNDGNVAVTAGPTGYFDFGNTRWANASGAGVATAFKQTNAASENPGAFTQTAEDTRAFTIGVRPADPSIVLYDYEAPNGTAMTYRARALHNYSGVYAASAWTTSSTATWTSGSWWLKHPNRPDLNQAVTVRSFPELQRAGRQGVFQPLGSTSAVVVSDTRGPKTGTVTLRSDTVAAQTALDALLDEYATLMLQGPANSGGPDYIRITGHSRQRVVDAQSAVRVFEALDFVAVSSPSGDVVAWPP